MQKYRKTLFDVLTILTDFLGIKWDFSTLDWETSEDKDWAIGEAQIELDNLKQERIDFSARFGGRFPDHKAELQMDQRIRRKEGDLQALRYGASIEGTDSEGTRVAFETVVGRVVIPLSWRHGWQIETDGAIYTARDLYDMIGDEMMGTKRPSMPIPSEEDWK